MIRPPDPPLGEPVAFAPPARPRRVALRGEHVLVRPLDAAADAAPLYAISHAPDGDPSIWTYLPDGPYEALGDYRRALGRLERSEDPLVYALVPGDGDGPARGVAAYLRITPEHGTIEIGHIWFGPGLRRTTAATEAIFLLARHALDDLGYRRLEWKCNALNAASRRAAERFGFTFEGVFRHHMVAKGRNRDTAWYAITDADWPAVRAGYEAWLAPENARDGGVRARPLRELIERAQRS